MHTRDAVGGPGLKGGPETHFLALRVFMNHKMKVLGQKNFEYGAVGTVLEKFWHTFEKLSLKMHYNEFWSFLGPPRIVKDTLPFRPENMSNIVFAHFA